MTFAKFALFDPIDVTARLHSMEQWVDGSNSAQVKLAQCWVERQQFEHPKGAKSCAMAYVRLDVPQNSQ
jgi:hypothetical protein